MPPTHLRDAFLLGCAGAVGWGGFTLAGQPTVAGLSIAAAAVGGAARVWAGGLSARRRRIRDLLVEALAGITGTRELDRRTVVLSHWSLGWPGTPRRVVIRYAPGAPDGEQGWRSILLDTLHRRLQASYKVVAHNQERCRVVLEIDHATSTPVASRMERALKDLIGPTARIRDFEIGESGDPVRITVTHDVSHKLAASGYRARVERTFSAIHPGRWRARWDLEGDEIVFELRPTFPKSIWLPPSKIDQSLDVLASYRQVSIPFGIDEDGTEMVWRPAIDPHLMVVGSTGTGKTVMEHTVLAGVARCGWPIWVVDGKSVEFLGFRSWPNVQVVAASVEDQVAVIHKAWEVMEYRYKLVQSGLVTEDVFEPLMLFVDEYADFRAKVTDWYPSVKVKGDPSKPPVLEKLASIARLGRTGRVHLLFATQRPDAEYFGGDFRDNFRMRVSVGRLSPQGAAMMWQDPTIGTTVPRLCPGRATTINDDNRPVEVQTYRVPDPRRVPDGDELQLQVLAALRPESATHERLLITPLEDEFDDENAPVFHGYRDFVAAEWVKAADHPELDPVNVAPLSPEEARRISRPMAMLKLDNGAPSVVPLPGLSRMPDTPQPAIDAGDGGEGAEWEDRGIFEGYEPAIDMDPEQLTVGDLVDLGDGRWVTVDMEPDPDLDDPEYVAIGWRDDVGDDGIWSVPNSELVRARHPIYEAEGV